jgi:hypothetical protein
MTQVPREVIMPFAGLVVGAVICSLPYLLYSAQFPAMAITAIALTLASTGLAIMRPSEKWWSGMAVGAGILVPIVTIIGIDLKRDPTSHNLFPFEIVFGLAFAMPGALLGAWLGSFIGRVTAVPALAGAIITAAGVLTAALHVPVVFAERAAGELDARKKFGALVTAQSRFYASNRGAYTCNLSKLGQAFDTPVRRHEPFRPTERIYKTGTWAKAGDYEFVLLCDQRPPGNRFLLTTAPARGALGRWGYCAEADGVIREVKRSQYNETGCGTGP